MFGTADISTIRNCPPAREQKERIGHMATSKIVKSAVRPPAAGKGRPKGSQNKTTKAVKEMILAALDKVGGEDYLVQQSEENPTAFLTLVGKVLPLQVDANVTGNVVHKVERTIVRPANPDG
jgi:hypothetical protein